MKRWWWTLPLLAMLALAAYVVAGPWLTIRGIDQAIAERDVPGLARHVDFPTLRVNLKAQLDDAMVRRAGIDAQSSMFGALALQAIGGVSNLAVDTMVTPAGVAALLQGRMLWKRASGDTIGGDTWSDTTPDHPLREAELHYLSTRRVTATVQTEAGTAIVLVLTRDGLHWKLSDIILPLTQ